MSFLFFMLGLFASFSFALVGFVITRRFVENRLRYVDAVQRPYAPFLAGAGAMLLALPLVAVLPFVGIGSALLFGMAVFAGVSSGAREIRRRIGA
jgi:hypothetical protein